MISKSIRWTAIIPWIFILLFYLLIIRYKVVYGLNPLEPPISDPKDINMFFHVKIIQNLFFLSIVTIPIFFYWIYLSLRHKNSKDTFITIILGGGLLLEFILVILDSNFTWFFD